MTGERVSVIVATFGDDATWAPLRARAVRSAWCQSRQPEIIAGHVEGATLAGARNELAAQATGDWLCFLDADDELTLGYLAAMVRARADRWLDAVYAPSVEYVERDETRVLRTPAELAGGHPMEVQNRAVIGSLVPRALFEQIGGFHEWPCFEDWHLWLRCLKAGAELIDVPDAVYRAYKRKGSRNTAGRLLRKQTWREIRADVGIEGPRPRRVARGDF